MICTWMSRGPGFVLMAVINTNKTKKNHAFLPSPERTIIYRYRASPVRFVYPTLCVFCRMITGRMTAKPETVRGMEKTMVVNHLGPFLLTMLLLPKLRRSAAPNPEDNNQPIPASRIINVASRLEKRGQLLMANDPATPAGTAWFKSPPGEHSPLGQYGTSKLCNLLFTFELHRRLAAATAPASNAPTGRVTVNAVTPGLVNTNLGDNAFSPWLRCLIRLPMAPIKALLFRNVYKAAETVTWAASSPAVEYSSGKFYGDMAEAACSKTAQDPELARNIWEASVVATGLNESERVG